MDNSATTRPRREAMAAMEAALEDAWGNPSSLHSLGVGAERVIKEAREAVARALGVDAAEIVFTSGGTEANNLALLGAARGARPRHVITTAVEHPSVLRAAAALEEEGFAVTYLPVDGEGRLDPAALARAITPDTVLVSTMQVNNEVGTLLDLEGIARVLGRAGGAGAGAGGTRHPAGPLWHVDAVQAFGKIPVTPRRLGIDLLTLSAHKVQGPKGVGALYVRKGVTVKALLLGGGQEGGRRAGTENVPGIAGFGAAARLAAAEQAEAAPRLARLRDRLIEGVLAAAPGSRLNGPRPDATRGGAAAPHIANLSFPGVRGEVLIHALEARGVYASTGAACSSRRSEPSHVLRAMALPGPDIEGAVRFSLSSLTTDEEVDGAVAAVARVVPELLAFARR